MENKGKKHHKKSERSCSKVFLCAARHGCSPLFARRRYRVVSLRLSPCNADFADDEDGEVSENETPKVKKKKKAKKSKESKSSKRRSRREVRRRMLSSLVNYLIYSTAFMSCDPGDVSDRNQTQPVTVVTHSKRRRVQPLIIFSCWENGQRS